MTEYVEVPRDEWESVTAGYSELKSKVRKLEDRENTTPYERLCRSVSLLLDQIPFMKGMKTKSLTAIQGALIVSLTQIQDHYEMLGFDNDLEMFAWLESNVGWIALGVFGLWWITSRAKDAHKYREVES